MPVLRRHSLERRKETIKWRKQIKINNTAVWRGRPYPNCMGAGLQNPIYWIIKKWNIDISFASYILFRGARVKYSRTAVNERYCISLFEGKKRQRTIKNVSFGIRTRLQTFYRSQFTLLIKWRLTDDSWTGPSLTNVLDGTSSSDNGDVVSDWVFMRMLPASIVELKKDMLS